MAIAACFPMGRLEFYPVAIQILFFAGDVSLARFVFAKIVIRNWKNLANLICPHGIRSKFMHPNKTAIAFKNSNGEHIALDGIIRLTRKDAKSLWQGAATGKTYSNFSTEGARKFVNFYFAFPQKLLN